MIQHRRDFLRQVVLTVGGLYVAPNLLDETGRRIFPVGIDLRSRTKRVELVGGPADGRPLTLSRTTEVFRVPVLADLTLPSVEISFGVIDYRVDATPNARGIYLARPVS